MSPSRLGSAQKSIRDFTEREERARIGRWHNYQRQECALQWYCYSSLVTVSALSRLVLPVPPGAISYRQVPSSERPTVQDSTAWQLKRPLTSMWKSSNP